MKRLWRDARGDTIVEVLIALTVISIVLVSAYGTARATLDNSRQAQERSEALKFVESQVERLKTIENDLDPFKTDIRCIDTSPASANYNKMVSAYSTLKTGAVAANTDGADPFGSYAAPCAVDNGGIKYYLSIEHSDTSATGRRFYSFRARWYRASGNGGRDEVKINYAVVGGATASGTSYCGYTCVVERRADEACGGRCPRPVKEPNDDDYFNWTFGNDSSASAPTCTWYVNLPDRTQKVDNRACTVGQGFPYSYLYLFPDKNNYDCIQISWQLVMHYPTGDDASPIKSFVIPWSRQKADHTPC